MKNITLKSLKQYLQKLSKEGLINEISDIYNKFDSVKDYYSKINSKYHDDVREKYKAIIKKEFFPSRGIGNGRLSIPRKAVSDYQKVSVSDVGLADIMIYYVEMGVDFTNEYGDIDEAFYHSMGSMYERALKHIVQNNLQNMFQNRCKRIVDYTADIGWGFHKDLSDSYNEYFACK